MENIGDKIRKRRIEIDMTQEELATKLGYKHKSSIAKIENGYNDVPQKKVVEFAHALKTTVAYLMGWEEEQQSEAWLDEVTALMEQMTDDQKRTFLSLGRALLNTDDRRNGST